MALDPKTFNKTEMNTCNVLIVGAGLAGIAAARTLFLANIEDIIILEAQNQIGGRISSLASKKGFIEYGAHWIHGENSTLKIFAEKHNLLSTILSDEGQGRFIRDDGYEFDSQFIDEVETVIVNILKKCESFCETNDACDFSVGEYLEIEFEKYLHAKVHPKNMTLWRELFEWHIKFQIIDNSCDSLKSLSAKSWGLYDFDGGDCQSHINFKDGYVSVLNKLMQLLPEGIIKCNTPVRNVIWNTTNSKKHRVKVVCENNNVFWADHVIATMSLGVLKSRYREMFSPHLPEKHVKSIISLGFASIGKIFIEFESNWWGDIKGIQLVWKIENAAGNEKPKKSSWVKHLSGFDVLTVGPPNSLLGWVDSQGVTIMESLTKEELANDCLLVLKKFTGRKEFPKIKNIERSMWDSNPYVRGCYSHITVDCDHAKVGPKTLAEPIMDNEGCPVLIFAGEACHQTFFSTTHGAFDSGTKQAEVLCRYILKQN